MKIVLDTNILASGIFWDGTPLKVIDLWEKEKLQALASDWILDEYLRTIHRIAKKIERLDLYRTWALTLPSKIEFVSVKKSFKLCRDPMDDMFIDCAIAGNARFIVSGDRDLLVLGQVLNVQIINPRQLLQEF